jgi:signal transduction histidine kinase
VFSRFHRILTTGASGSGLGLSIVSRIAELHGADVQILEGRDGRGTEVLVRFPGAALPSANPLAEGGWSLLA